LKDSVDRNLKAEANASLLESGKRAAGWAHCGAGFRTVLEPGKGSTGIEGAKKYAAAANGSSMAAAALRAVGLDAGRGGCSWVGSDFSMANKTVRW